MKIFSAVLTLAIAGACASAQASTVTCTGGALAIPDTNTWVSATPTTCPAVAGYVRKITLTVTFTHPRPSDLHFILGASSAFYQRSAWAYGAAGGTSAFTGTITLDDAAALTLPNSALTNNQFTSPRGTT